MQKIRILLLGLALATTALWAADEADNDNAKAKADAAEAEVELNSVEQQYSYMLGMSQGRSLMMYKEALEMDAFMYGFLDALAENDAALTPTQVQQAQKAFEARITELQQKQMQERQAKQQKMMQEAPENKKKAEEFLKENAKKEGVKTTDSGLQYKVLEEGSGESPDMDSRVYVYYTGKLIDGTEFDSNAGAPEPTDFHLKGVVPGFSEGISQMKKGAKYRLYIPPELGYGMNIPSLDIPYNALLIFDVELVDFKPEEYQPPRNMMQGRPQQ